MIILIVAIASTIPFITWYLYKDQDDAYILAQTAEISIEDAQMIIDSEPWILEYIYPKLCM